MNRYGSRKHRVAAGLAMVALMVVVAVVATTVEEPEANALPFGGGVPVRIWFNADPARAGDDVQLWVQLSETATLTQHKVALEFPTAIQVPPLSSYPSFVTVDVGQDSGFTDIQDLAVPSSTEKGYVSVIGTLNGGRAGGVLEVKP